MRKISNQIGDLWNSRQEKLHVFKRLENYIGVSQQGHQTDTLCDGYNYLEERSYLNNMRYVVAILNRGFRRKVRFIFFLFTLVFGYFFKQGGCQRAGISRWGF